MTGRRGLTSAEAARRLAGEGPNALPVQRRMPAWRLLAAWANASSAASIGSPCATHCPFFSTAWPDEQRRAARAAVPTHRRRRARRSAHAHNNSRTPRDEGVRNVPLTVVHVLTAPAVAWPATSIRWAWSNGSKSKRRRSMPTRSRSPNTAPGQ
ncbi:cation-transporting P-type ATPase [Mycobacterium sp.]|uniref:cation-transporting P-type ATPase n=1 Tax=Mycobacterium sp. TaxID=1785 RepID=UPI003C708B65